MGYFRKMIIPTYMKYRFFSVLILAVLLSLLFTGCGDAAPAGTGAANAQNQATAAAQMATGKFQEFALPQSGSGLMRPVLDSRGRVWFGEMNRNYLGSFDSRIGKFWQQTPPDGKYGIMGIVAAPDDTIWFAEQYADYIGHYFPQSGTYKTYQLPTISQPDPSNAGKTLSLPSAPNDIALDKHGTLWFTELNASAIGSLNTATGAMHQYPLTGAQKGQALNPYGIAVDPQGMIWFTEATSNRLGRLNPANGQVSYFAPPGVTSSLMELASDARGQLWATTFSTGQLICFNPAQNNFTLYNAPTPNGESGGMYGVTVASNGDIWVTVTSENLLARLDVKAQRFFYYPIPTPNSQPIGLVESANHEIWFTESGGNKIGMLQF